MLRWIHCSGAVPPALRRRRGAAVLDDRGKHVANVDDVVVSTEDHKLHAVIAMGGFLGWGAKLVSLPFDELQITAAGNDPQVRIKMTGAQLAFTPQAGPLIANVDAGRVRQPPTSQ